MLLAESMASTAAMQAVFSARATVQAMLEPQAALARAGAAVGMIPAAAAAEIAQACRAEMDIDQLAADGAVLLLLSGLSAHTRQLRDDPRCAVLVSGLPEGVNPQTAPRVTVVWKLNRNL